MRAPGPHRWKRLRYVSRRPSCLTPQQVSSGDNPRAINSAMYGWRHTTPPILVPAPASSIC